ncbi:LysR family transcriptional regulator [Enterococcus sp. 669A]|uniref:LysR family transcriptional regulator n=1 Tax=Candidatus Enterococcus moelleringii TaxID=2815325 RepID=A0ABS3LCF5_9ENTE|nr:LysR family transcriptional regulator [Enterococcus sp. 669A]MBO1307315.1 LysR family transcriptional regulator [Enterococcus sp. 669A]
MVMNLHSLEIFIEVAERGSFTEAARNLYVTQPAISKAIKNIEVELSVKLFQRDKRNGLILTDVGAKILVLARQMLDIDNKIYQAAFKENNFLGGRVRIGSIFITTTVILSKAIAMFQEKYPFVKIELYEGTAREVNKMVMDHAVDFAISISPFNKMEYEVLVEDEMVAISNREIDGLVNIISDDRKFVFGQAGAETAIDTLGKEYEIPFEKWFQVARGETVLSMAQSGVGIGIISQFVLDSIPNQLYRAAVYPQVKMEYGIITNSFAELTPVAKEFVRIIKKSNQSS